MTPDFSKLQIKPSSIHYNLDYESLYKYEVEKNEGIETDCGAMAVDTGIFTGRSPKDKYFVKEKSSESNIWWGPVNAPIDEAIFDELNEKVHRYLDNKEIFVVDAFCGANESTRLKVRVVTCYAWQAHFCKNMFIRPEESDLENFDPDFTILNASDVKNENYKKHGLNSEVFIAFNLSKKLAIIGGTNYGGEMKKGIFSIMNYFLPLKGILSMHCSANQGDDGKTALFFGLSGTGKTTLSADPERELIGDDEHGWDNDGVFNFEGGCYAKTINLNPETEPDIFHAIKRDALLENVVVNEKTKIVDYADDSKTQNTRASYPLYHIEKIVKPISKGEHPSHIIFLTCDAFGVLPPVSFLTDEQASYYFLSGYTAKIAGTERGVKEPEATFSACFGGPFLTLHPTKYAQILAEKIKTHKSKVYLVNTGWIGGPYGTGKRINLPETRTIIHDILNDSILDCPTIEDPVFHFKVPVKLKDVPDEHLVPWKLWNQEKEYFKKSKELASMFIANYKQFQGKDSHFDFSEFGPRF